MFTDGDRLSIGTLLRRFPKQISVTWGLTLVETAVFAAFPLLIGWSIDGLLAGDWSAFLVLIAVFVLILIVAFGRRVYDTRAYGTIRVEMGKTQAERTKKEPVSVINARVLMGRELVDFLEVEAPIAAMAFIQVIAAVIILLSFHGVLALTAGGTAVAILVIYGLFSKRFFRLNSELNEQSENQVTALETGSPKKIAAHFIGLRRQEVRLSDLESVVYGIIFTVLMAMLGFNLWFAATQLGASPGNIFSIVTYSLEFLESSVTLPAALQSLTRLSEITDRINRTDEQAES